MTDGASWFEVGSTVVRRNVFRGRVLSAVPCRVVESQPDDGLLATARWPGVVGWWEKSWVDWLRTGDDTLRTDLIDDLAAGTWELTPWTWRDTAKLELLVPGAYFSVSLFLTGAGEPPSWYVDFIRPYPRTAHSVDTFDLLLDLVIAPDGSLRWKDEAEYAQGRSLGIISAADHEHVQRAREEVVGRFERRAAPFEDRWLAWRPDPSWPLPTLSGDSRWLTARS